MTFYFNLKINPLILKKTIYKIHKEKFLNVVTSNDLNFFKKKKNFLNKAYKSVFTLKIFFKYLDFFFLNLKNVNKNMSNFLYFLEIMSIFKNNLFFNNPIFFINWYSNFFNFVFFLKINKTKKTIQKNVSLLKKTKRNEYFFKLLNNIKFLKKNNSFADYYFFAMNDTYLNFKDSIIYKNKITIYKKLVTN